MKYLINDRIVFNTLEYRLSLLADDETAVNLSNTAGRVLEALIISHGNGDTVSREDLFANVWEKHGLSPSNGNLNQQVSLIRKALIALGLEASAIVTLPKRGLKLNDRLAIAVYDQSPDPALDTPVANDNGGGMETAAPKTDHFTKELMINLFLALSIIITVSTTYVYFRQDDRQPLYFFKNIDSCNIYTLRPINDRERPDLAAHIQRAMAGNIARCDAHDKVLFSRTAATIKDGINRRTFLAKCEQEAGGKLTGCLNFYFYNWDV
ncbi:winged helix-turn-helix domain-containing protein [Sodalis sp. RH20]|uniref:winged helix-turn-helix domain-containing protein n=1 Tax=unclassified Sodalis (in: enterobacteria) TaxID=2636512 RepID=UPI0039B49834